MRVEHDGLASHLVLPRITFPASDTMTEQIADPVEHRSSMIALRRRAEKRPGHRKAKKTGPR